MLANAAKLLAMAMTNLWPGPAAPPAARHGRRCRTPGTAAGVEE